LVDIDIQSEISEADQAVLSGGADKPTMEVPKQTEPGKQEIEVERNDTAAVTGTVPEPVPSQKLTTEPDAGESTPSRTLGKHASLATPAVRHVLKQMKINIEEIEGTGKDGRVLKEDVHKFSQARKEATAAAATPLTPPAPTQQLEDQVKPLNPVQNAMYKQMTRSLSIPHFLYTDTIDLTALQALRQKLNAGKEKSERITTFPFIIKAISLALQKYPILNSHLDNTTNPDKPHLIYKATHNIGIAVDSPLGLLVPVIRNVQSLSIEAIAQEILRLSGLARAGKLSSADLSGATFTVSNIGKIGGTSVAPVIVTPQVGIVAIGKARAVPAFGENGEIVRKEECVFSWSADHRVIDGATAARLAETVRGYLERVETMVFKLR